MNVFAIMSTLPINVCSCHYSIFKFILKECNRSVTVEFITFVFEAYQNLLRGVFTLITCHLVISIYYLNNGYMMMHLWLFICSLFYSNVVWLCSFYLLLFMYCFFSSSKKTSFNIELNPLYIKIM